MCLASSTKSASPDSKQKKLFLVSEGVSIATLAVLNTRSKGFGITVQTIKDSEMLTTLESMDKKNSGLLGIMLQYPDVNGGISDYSTITSTAKRLGAKVCVGTDLLALTLLKPPGEWGADMVFGNSARFGVPAGYGGPHAAFFSCTDGLKRKMPGRLVGLSKDTRGQPAYRLALQSEFEGAGFVNLGLRKSWLTDWFISGMGYSSRATYQKRESYLQRLYRSSSSRQYGRHVCRLSRT